MPRVMLSSHRLCPCSCRVWVAFTSPPCWVRPCRGQVRQRLTVAGRVAAAALMCLRRDSLAGDPRDLFGREAELAQSCLSGAEAPKVCMPTTAPASPT